LNVTIFRNALLPQSYHRPFSFAPSPAWTYIVVLALTTGFAPHADAQSISRGPYLQISTPTSVIVRWRTDQATDSRVIYGRSLENLTKRVDSQESTREHVMRVSGLVPGTKYYYAVGSSTTVLAGDNAGYFFVTAPSPGTEKPVHVWVLGDSGTADSKAERVRDAYSRVIGNTHTDLCLMLGDNAYENGSDAEYQRAVFDMYPDLLRQTVLWPTIGNHDALYAGPVTQVGPYFDMFSLPRLGEAGGAASGTEAFYSFDYANIHFICLDSYVSDRSPGGPMLTWLQNDLAATTRKWIIAFWHHPPYSMGTHESDTERRLVDMRENAVPILESYGADLVLSGHSHSYERSYQLHGHYGTSETLTPDMIVNGGDGHINRNGPYVKASTGTVYIVAGSSGKTTEGPLDHPAMCTSLMKLGSIALEITGNRLDVRFISDRGAIKDRLTILKGTSSHQGPALYASEEKVMPVDVEASTPKTIDIQVADSADDAEESAAGTTKLSSSDLEIVYDGGEQTVGLRFSKVPIPQGATIDRAYIQFKVDETNSGDTSLTIIGEDRDDASSFSATHQNISSRRKTTASVSWSPAPWDSTGKAGPDQCSPNIASIVQALVSRLGWSSGNAMAFIITGKGERTAESYDGDQAGAPVLHVEYTSP
jgi:hypothetical protein